jgi:hypothetical protein
MEAMIVSSFYPPVYYTSSAQLVYMSAIILLGVLGVARSSCLPLGHHACG